MGGRTAGVWGGRTAGEGGGGTAGVCGGRTAGFSCGQKLERAKRGQSMMDPDVQLVWEAPPMCRSLPRPPSPHPVKKKPFFTLQSLGLSPADQPQHKPTDVYTGIPVDRE